MRIEKELKHQYASRMERLEPGSVGGVADDEDQHVAHFRENTKPRDRTEPTRRNRLRASLRRLRKLRAKDVQSTAGDPQGIEKENHATGMQVGVPTPGGFRGYTLTAIAQDTGLSLKRMSRVIADFEDGSWRAVAAIKTVSKHLFKALNLGTMLQRERKKARRRQDARCLEEERAPASQAAKRAPGRRQPNASPSKLNRCTRIGTANRSTQKPSGS